MKLLKAIHSICFVTILTLFVLLANFVAEIYPGEPDYPRYAHITLYLDRNFTDLESDIITKAAWEWSEATNHTIEYDIIQLPTQEKLKLVDSIFLIKKSPDDPQIILMDLKGGNKTLGAYDRNLLPTISIVADRLDLDIYKEIVLHELGHSLGIQHLESMDDLDTLMFPYASMELPDGTIIPTGSDHITHRDLVAFCKLYHCDADKLKH